MLNNYPELEKLSKHITPPVNLEPNVIRETELQKIFQTVFGQMADIVSKTYGPFGATTAYQEGGRFLTTKDGWSVEQSIHYPNSALASIIRKMIIDVSTAINLKAGDGTTTGLIAANEINNLLTEYKKAHKVHSKFLSSAVEFAVEKICDKLMSIATSANDENYVDTIHKVALVALDWDYKLAGFIRDIYKNTQNTIIRVQDSGTEHSYVTYEDGYYLSAKLISEFSANNAGEKKYVSDKVVLLMFSYTINASMWESLITAAMYIKQKLGRDLVVLAPNFDKGFKDAYNQYCIRVIKNKQPLPSLVMVRYFVYLDVEREMMTDFCLLTGGIMNTPNHTTLEEVLHEFVKITKSPVPQRSNYADGEGGDTEFAKDIEHYRNLMITAGQEFEEHLKEYIGICDKIEVTDKHTIASGFGDVETSEALEQRKTTIKAKIEKAYKDMTAKSMVTENARLETIRLGKLKLKMGTINVGGFGEGQLKAKRDALDDAIRACERAYMYGVVPGGGISIIKATEEVGKDLINGNLNSELDKKGIDYEIFKNVINFFGIGFIETVRTMFRNRYNDGIVDDVIIGGKPVTIDDLINTSVEQNTPWDLIRKTINPDIIHPVRVETEVVKGVLNLVLNTININQLLYISYDDTRKELENMREVRED